MVKVICGRKGTGKTKLLVDTANDLAGKGNGDIVFIDGSNQLIYNLLHKIRFINISEFPIAGWEALSGFICGIISENYDTVGILIDGLNNIVREDLQLSRKFFDSLEKLSSSYNIDFYISVCCESVELPEFINSLAA